MVRVLFVLLPLILGVSACAKKTPASAVRPEATEEPEDAVRTLIRSDDDAPDADLSGDDDGEDEVESPDDDEVEEEMPDVDMSEDDEDDD